MTSENKNSSSPTFTPDSSPTPAPVQTPVEASVETSVETPVSSPAGFVLPPKKERNETPKGTPKSRAFYLIKTIFYLCASSFLVAISSYCIIAPNNFATGGVTGIAIILEKVTKGKVPQSVSMLCLNLPLLLLAFFFVKKKFAIISMSYVFAQSLWLMLMERLHMPTLDFGSEKIFAALAGGIGIGAAIALAFKIGGSTGGMDIVAVMVQRKFPAPSIAWMIFILNCVVIASSFFVYRVSGDPTASVMPLIMAACEQYVESKINDTLTNGLHSATEFRVITDKPEELARAIISKMGRGVTSLPATGMYTREKHAMLVCVINRRQINAFRKILKETDPDSFAVMSPVSQVLGLGFFSGEN